MPERETHDSDFALASVAPATPRAVDRASSRPQDSEDPPESSMHAFELRSTAPPSSEHDTLLSAGKPADRLEVLLEDRLAQLDERLRELDQRLSVLEQSRRVRGSEPIPKPWLWIAFLIALVVVFQLLHRVR